MKKLLMCVLILLSVNLYAQEQKEVQAIPELQEWYSWKGGFTGAYISYLPDFDSVGGGVHAITQGRDGDGVWYNRFPFDTLSQFRWKSQGSYAVYHADFNSDGIQDYFDFKGRIYTSLKKKTKPNPEPVIQIQRGGTVRPLIGDLNGDGYDDLLAFNDDNYFDVILGKKELNQIKSVTVKYSAPSVYVGGYITEQGKPRIVTFESNEIAEAFYLYDVQITNSGETPTVQLKKLDEIVKFRESKDERFFEKNLSALYWSSISGSSFLSIIEAIKPGDTKTKNLGYKIIKDKFVFVKKGSPGAKFWSDLNGSIDGDDEEDFIVPSVFKINGDSKEGFSVYSGNPLDNQEPVAYFLRSYCGDDHISFIGDVNNDSIGDIAYGGNDGCFAVFLGIDWRTVGNYESINILNTFTLHQNIPNPIGKDRKAVLPISLKAAGNYTLTIYDMRGLRIKELFNGLLHEGDVNLPLDLSGLSSGMYILKMSDGKQTRERAIIIGE